MSDELDSDVKRDAQGRFLPGQSGNVYGGSRASRAVKAAFAEHADEIVEAVLFAIAHGDVGAMKLALDRIAPALKPSTEPHPIAGLAEAETLADKARVVLNAIASGEIDAGIGAQVLTGIGNAAQLAELETLKQRLAALESRDLV